MWLAEATNYEPQSVPHQPLSLEERVTALELEVLTLKRAHEPKLPRRKIKKQCLPPSATEIDFNHAALRAIICSATPVQLYRHVALINRGWWQTLQRDKGYQQAQCFDDLYDAGKAGRRDMVELFINWGATDWNMGMYGAARGGHKELVEFFIERGATDWNRGMNGAAQGGHKELVDFFIKQGATAWNYGLYGAAQGGHKELEAFFRAKLQGH